MNQIENITIGQLFPNLTEDELKEAQADFEQYLALVLRVYLRLQQDEKWLAELRAFTTRKPLTRCKAKVELPMNHGPFPIAVDGCPPTSRTWWRLTISVTCGKKRLRAFTAGSSKASIPGRHQSVTRTKAQASSKSSTPFKRPSSGKPLN